jgi:glycosyltransferase involved in cell wall biosynthesis
MVSIGMPIYNGEKYLREALDSILSQTLANFELIPIFFVVFPISYFT